MTYNHQYIKQYLPYTKFIIILFLFWISLNTGSKYIEIEYLISEVEQNKFNFIEGESLIMGLKDVAVSSGSACTSASLEPSYVLRALGRKDELAHSSIRFSFGRFTSESEVLSTLNTLKNVVERLRELSPLWEMHLDGIDLDSVEWKMH